MTVLSRRLSRRPFRAGQGAVALSCFQRCGQSAWYATLQNTWDRKWGGREGCVHRSRVMEEGMRLRRVLPHAGCHRRKERTAFVPRVPGQGCTTPFSPASFTATRGSLGRGSCLPEAAVERASVRAHTGHSGMGTGKAPCRTRRVPAFTLWEDGHYLTRQTQCSCLYNGNRFFFPFL